MAERCCVLTMTPREEEALSQLLSYMCMMERKNGALSEILGHTTSAATSPVEAIGRINSALNAVR